MEPAMTANMHATAGAMNALHAQADWNIQYEHEGLGCYDEGDPLHVSLPVLPQL